MTEEKNLLCVILAAGEGTRMKSSRPKVLFPICGRPMLEYVLDAAFGLSPEKTIVVVGHGKEEVQKTVLESWALTDDRRKRLGFSVQAEQKGTGHALSCGLNGFSGQLEDLPADTLVLYGDTPLIQTATLLEFRHFHEENRNDISILSTILDDPDSYGRIVRDSKGAVQEIVEARDLKAEQASIKEVNSGIYLIKTKYLPDLLAKIDNNNAKKEYYLTDIVGLGVMSGLRVDSFVSPDKRVLQGVNDRFALSQAESAMRETILRQLALCGVTIKDLSTTYVDWGVRVKEEAVLEPFTVLKGKTSIGQGAIIGPGSEIIDSEVGQGARVWHSCVEHSVVEAFSQVGPFAHIRPGSVICEGSLIGNFAEIKNSTVGKGSKVHHHSYIGDSFLGESVNIGAGTVTVNYDGVKKHRTTIEDGAFIGCNANLIAPVTIGKNAYVAAGSTITQDVPADSLGIARERQANKEGWVSKRRRIFGN